jgi:hypothetical protein
MTSVIRYILITLQKLKKRALNFIINLRIRDISPFYMNVNVNFIRNSSSINLKTIFLLVTSDADATVSPNH